MSDRRSTLRLVGAGVLFALILTASWMSISRIRADAARSIEAANESAVVASLVTRVELRENALVAVPASTASAQSALASSVADLQRSVPAVGSATLRDELNRYLAEVDRAGRLIADGQWADALAFESSEESLAQKVTAHAADYSAAMTTVALDANRYADALSLAVRIATLIGLAVGVGLLWALHRRGQLAKRRAIEEQEARFRALVEHGGDAILLVDEAGNITFASDSSVRVIGKPPDELVGRAASSIAGGDDRARLVKALDSARRRPDRVASVSLAIGEGEARVVELNAVSRVEDPAVGAVVLNVRDITERRLAQAALARSDQLLTDLLHHAPVIIYIKDLDGRYLRVNDAWQRIVGHEEVEAVGSTAASIFEPATAALIEVGDRRAIEEGAYEQEEQMVIAGQSRLMLTSRFPLSDRSGSPYAVAGISLDTTERIRLQDIERQIGAVLTYAPDAMFASRSGRITTWNPAAELMFGYTAEEIIGSDVAVLVDSVDRSQVPALRQLVGAGEMVQGHEMVGVRKDGSTFVGSLTATPLRDPLGVVVGVSSIVRDVTAQHEHREELLVQSRTDALTGLPNRAALLDHLRGVIEGAPADGATLPALMILGLDRFRLINDALGQDSGDRVLQIVARRLDAAVGPGGFAARIGADEFALLQPEAAGRSAQDVSRELQLVVAARMDIGPDSTSVTASVGIAPAVERRASVWLRDASSALSLAKRSGPGGVALYDDSLRRQTAEELSLLDDLRVALRSESLVAYYQPIVDLSSGAAVGFEALARWQHPQRGLIAPDVFIGLAEEAGLIRDLGRQIRLAACHQLSAWQSELGRRDLEISMNVSVHELGDPGFVGDLVATMSAAHVDPRTVVLEITESALAESGQVMHVLEDVVSLGVRLAIDDFGTGYSSLNYLLRFPVALLKIDRSFVVESDESAQGVAVLKSVVDLARAMKLTTIAEGIETPRQRSLLTSLGCDHGQGFLWGPPVPADAALANLIAIGRATKADAGQESPEIAGADSATMRARKLSKAGASTHTIAAILNREGLRNQGKRWSATAVEGLIQHEPL